MPTGTRYSDLPDWSQNDASGGECGVPYRHRFPLPRSARDPQAAALSNPPFWYSFDYGPAHFVVLSSEHRVDLDSPQYQWLEK
jgi:hypothetical protein